MGIGNAVQKELYAAIKEAAAARVVASVPGALAADSAV